jgi:serine/threonine protein kinase
MQVASGLAAAHAQGLVHRDCKPANVLLENGVERVMITDFGLARAVDDASVTQSGVLAGTPQYMAPEQAKGETIDHRADLFSLGSVLYAMGTGRSPFRAETTMGVLRRICESTPRPIREVNPEIPDWLAEIIEKLHAKDPAERFQSAAEVAELLGRHLAHLQHPAAAPMPERLKGRPAGPSAIRRLANPLGIAAAVLLLVGGLVMTGTLKITSIWNLGADPVQEGRQEKGSPSAASTGAQGSPTESDAAEPAFKVIPSDLLHWDDGLEDPIDQLGQRIREVQEHRDEPSQDDASLDAASAIDRQLRELEQDLKSLP